MVVLRCSLLDAVRKSIEDVVGDAAAGGLLYRCYKKAMMGTLEGGVAAGKGSQELLDYVFRRGIELGLFTKYEILESKPDKVTFRVYDSAFAHDSSADHPICHLIAGRMAGTLSAITKEDFDCREVTCKAMGSPHCEFVARK